uniref:Uncharacterized protein n=1 Tax=Coccidioides posadasii RMSCC 3488 TaxID=454284 RepID=A0A0J6F7V2_COCPO|nr:hypothetical protein CPAG_01726 [Coccidioides posadasii RMSCC 3488]
MPADPSDSGTRCLGTPGCAIHLPLRRARMSSHRDILIRAPRRQEEFLQRKLKKKCDPLPNSRSAPSPKPEPKSPPHDHSIGRPCFQNVEQIVRPLKTVLAMCWLILWGANRLIGRRQPADVRRRVARRVYTRRPEARRTFLAFNLAIERQKSRTVTWRRAWRQSLKLGVEKQQTTTEN